jgi:4-amino-4-deoxy-L-arabinose transferase-like glycosyltransferase
LEQSPIEAPRPLDSPILAMAALLLCIVLSLTLRIAAPSDIYDNDQPGPIAHIVDVAVNDQWLMQRQPSGRLATKPPMYPWLGGLAVKAIGRYDEWVFKLPIILAFLVTTGLILDLARRELGLTLGCLAAMFWVANYHVFKLMYTARTDMLVTMWIVLGLWCVQRVRDHWRQDAVSGVPIYLIAIFWLSVAAGLLTKGPPAFLPAVWLVMCIVIDRAWLRSRPVLQIVGLVAAGGLALAWLVPALRAYPEWIENINREVADRVAGTGSGSDRGQSSRFEILAYFFGRFAPWGVLAVLACVEIWRKGTGGWRQRLRHPLVWCVAWTALVLVVFMIPAGRRADYILPAYAGAAILAAWVVGEAVGERGRWVLALARFVALTLAVALGVYQISFSAAAKTRAGEHLHQLVRQAKRLSFGRPIAVYRAGYTPVQALLGRNDLMDSSALARLESGGVLITSEAAWEAVEERFADRATILSETPKLPESNVTLLLIDIAPD